MIFRAIIVGLLAFAASLAAAPRAIAALNVFACEPEWAALASELGGEDVSVFTATTARQDPHQIQARPALIARLRGADIAVCTGAELEIGWMPRMAHAMPSEPSCATTSSRRRLRAGRPRPRRSKAST